MTDQEIREVRKQLFQEWKRQAFDAFMLGLQTLELTERDQDQYVEEARYAAFHLEQTCFMTRRYFLDYADRLLEHGSLPPTEKDALRMRMYVRFMEGRIRYNEFQERLEHSLEPPVPVGTADFHNAEFAAVLARLREHPVVNQFFSELDRRWNAGSSGEGIWTDYQLMMVNWFAGQLSVCRGKYTRTRPNHSARVTYQRMQNPFALLWLALSLGEDPGVILRAAQTAYSRETDEEKCIAIRNLIPFHRIYALALPLVEEERERSMKKVG